MHFSSGKVFRELNYFSPGALRRIIVTYIETETVSSREKVMVLHVRTIVVYVSQKSANKRLI